jgi:putative ABC transport system permease protein
MVRPRINALHLKLARDIWRLRGQVVSIALIVGAGVMSVITLQSTLRSLELSRDAYYTGYRFADVFAPLNRAPLSVADRLAELPGVAAVDTRVATTVVLEVPGLELPALGRLLSVPERAQPVLNALHLRSGRWISPGAHDEALISERFAEVNRLDLGDTVYAVINGRHRALRIVGLALSPEFTYEVEPTAGFFSDERLFGVLWLGREALEAAEDMTGAFNDVVLRLGPGAEERAVIAGVDAILEPYGGLGAYGRYDQLSNRLLEDEIAQNRATATLIPLIFLGIAAFLLNIVLLRLVSLERDQIGTLKAFGYTNGAIARHYLALAAAAIGIGAVIGMAIGFRLGAAYTALYAQYFRFPALLYAQTWDVAIGAVAISGAAALAGALSAVRAAARLQPAEAMRPEAPAEFRPLLIERAGLHRFLSPAQRMVLRNVERRPVRTLLSALGVGFSLAILVIGFTLLDSLDEMIYRQFTVVQREDASVTFAHAVDRSAAAELARVPGIIAAEPLRTVPVRISNGHRSRRLALTGIEADGRMRVMADADGAVHPLPPGGVVLSERLARILDAREGDLLRVELLERRDVERTVQVAALMDELIGMNAYLALDELSALVGESPRATGANLAIERGAERAVFDALRERPAIVGTVSKTAMIRSFEDQMAESMVLTMSILLSLAAVLAVGVIYNGARIALSERGRELASLRVLGFTRAEVAAMLLGEQGLITAVGLPIGAAIGAALSMLIARAYDTDLYRMPLVLRAQSFLIAGLAVIVIAVLAGLLVRRRLDRADLIAVLKTRE